MTARMSPARIARFVQATLLAVSAIAATAADAHAACFTKPVQTRIVPPKLQAFAAAVAGEAPERLGESHQIVGMWSVSFYINNGQTLWDQAFELFHADGTELAVDNAVPPVLGNVCIGTWKSAGPKSIKLRHMTWNWNLDGTPAGTFLLLMTATVSQDGRAYEGTFVSDSFDLQGTAIPALHAEGTVRGARITVD